MSYFIVDTCNLLWGIGYVLDIFTMADDGLSLFLMGTQPTTVYCVNT